MTPSQIAEQAAANFEQVKALFDELQRRLEPLETVIEQQGNALDVRKDRILELEGQVGALRDANQQLLYFALSQRPFKKQTDDVECQRLKALSLDGRRSSAGPIRPHRTEEAE